MKMAKDIPVNVGLEVPESKEERIARLRARAEELAAADETDEQILVRLVAESKARRIEALRAQAETEASVAAAPKPVGKDHNGFPRRYVRININRGATKEDLSYAPVGVNGYVFKIRRGVDVIVPSVVLDVLDHAVSDATIQVEGGLVFQPAMRFPYQFKGEVSEAEYLAYSQKMRAEHTQAEAAARAV